MSATAPTELTAICHILPMDEGLYCVSLGEPAQPSAAGANLPGVRLSLPPGPQSEHQGITISTFRADGWLDLDRPAALVHVAKGPARVMLTIYHHPSQPKEAAPRLVITQLGQMLPRQSGEGGNAPRAGMQVPPGQGSSGSSPPGFSGSGPAGPGSPSASGVLPPGFPPSGSPSSGFSPSGIPSPGIPSPGGHAPGTPSSGFPPTGASSKGFPPTGGPAGAVSHAGTQPFGPGTSTPLPIVTGIRMHADHETSVIRQTTAQTAPETSIIAHIRNRGDVQTRLGEWVGLPGSRLWIEGFGVALPAGWTPGDLEYQGIVGTSGATPWLPAPEFCGSRGQTMPLLGFGLRLKGAAQRLYDCTYRASFIDGSTSGPMAQGQLCQGPNQAAVEALQIVLTRKPA